MLWLSHRAFIVLWVIIACLSCGGGGGGAGTTTAPTSSGDTRPPPVGGSTTAPPSDLTGVISGRVTNYDTTRPVLASLTSIQGNAVFQSRQVGSDGAFKFTGLDTSKRYVVSINQPGYKFAPLTQTRNLTGNTNSMVVSTGETAEYQGEAVEGLSDDRFVFYWAEDVSVSGREYMSYINRATEVEINGKTEIPVDHQASLQLYEQYGVVLVDGDGNDHMPWTAEHAYRLLATMKQVPQNTISRDGDNETARRGGIDAALRQAKKSRWRLSSAEMLNDIVITTNADNTQDAVVGVAAFTYAVPVIGTVDSKRGRFFSKRLHRAVVRYVTDHGKNRTAVSKIIRERYGIEVATDDNFGGRYSWLPATGEIDHYPSRWRVFKPNEFLLLINMLEEFPTGMHKLSFNNPKRGLLYILRRADGHPHPRYPGAPAVAWATANYIEFMESAFINIGIEDVQRLIIHEKAHFIWHYLLSTTLKRQWLRLSGWYRAGSNGNCDQFNTGSASWQPVGVLDSHVAEAPDDHDHQSRTDTTPINVDAQKGWATCSTTQFVSAYANVHNPSEDFAESIAYFMVNANLLRSRAAPKYAFIRDYIMQGSIYLSTIRQDLTFQVYNLFPDYIYPGKINKVDIVVRGAPEEDKILTVEIGLHTISGCNDEQTGCFEGATQGVMRIFSPVGTFHDMHLRAVPGSNGTLLRNWGTQRLSRYVKKGWWAPAQIRIRDQAGNDRFERVENADFGWKMYINNPLEDTTPPRYVAKSIEIKKTDDTKMEVKWRVQEENFRRANACYTRVASTAAGQTTLDEYGVHAALSSPQHDNATDECKVEIDVTDFGRQGHYYPSFIEMIDLAKNIGQTDFVRGEHPTLERAPSVHINPSNPDTQRPELDESACQTQNVTERCIRVTAAPTNPVQPNGETRVVLTYWARDSTPNASGVRYAWIFIRDPQGITQSRRHYLPDRDTFWRDDFTCPAGSSAGCNASTWLQYTFTHILPVGSPPGTWGIPKIDLVDRAGNTTHYNFTEIIRFSLENGD